MKKLIIMLVALIAVSSTGWVNAEDMPRTVSVSGSGEIVVAPDKASVSVGVEARKKNLDEARLEVSNGVKAFLDLADSLGIERRHVSTSSLTLRPEYRWVPASSNKKGENVRQLVGYYVHRQIGVDLRDLDKLGRLLEGAVDAGINNVSSPQFGVSNEKDLQRQALARAAADARANAAVLAISLDAELGQVRKITASSSGGPRPQPMYRARGSMESMASSDAAGNYESGEIRLTASVNAEFELR